jgi:hypothetical protein
MARPKVNIDWKTVDSLLEADCEGTEIAAYIGIHPDTLYIRCKEENKMGFSEYLREKKAKGNSLLKVTQFNSAIKYKSVTMQIWLGKQRLEQKEKSDITQTNINPNERPLEELSFEELMKLRNNE